jgi:hypothetical protein
MNIVSMGNLGAISTEKEVSLVINEHIYGPFPNNLETYNLLVRLIENPDDTLVLKRLKRARRACLNNRKGEF